MYRYPDGTFKIIPPAKVEYQGYIRKFAELTVHQRDEIGFNEAVPIVREPFTTYETEWVKGEDSTYREGIVRAVVDEAAKVKAEASAIRAERDRLLRASDWTQVADAPVDQAAWATYRQALRDVPGQESFPRTVEWPVVGE